MKSDEVKLNASLLSDGVWAYHVFDVIQRQQQVSFAIHGHAVGEYDVR